MYILQSIYLRATGNSQLLAALQKSICNAIGSILKKKKENIPTYFTFLHIDKFAPPLSQAQP
jgi:hypothetical protein